MKEAVVVDACRSPIGRAGDRGIFRAISHIDLMVQVLKALVERNKLDPNLIEDITIGSAALGGTMTRNILQVAGFPQSVAGCDTSRQCASASNAIANAARQIMNDDADVVIAGGLETMDRMGPIQPWQIGARGAPGRQARPRAHVGRSGCRRCPRAWALMRI